MKKLLILASVLAITMSTVMASETAKTPVQNQKPIVKTEKLKKFDLNEKLNLTAEQKEQAKLLRQKSRQEIKPIMEQIKAKHEEIREVAKSDLTEAEKNQKIKTLKDETKVLGKKIHQIRKQNMKDFEAILTPAQKKELAKIKAEGRKQFKKTHRPFKCHNCVNGPQIKEK